MAGRKNKYETHVKPRFDEIKKWLKRGALDNEIIKALGIGKSAFYEYLNAYPELMELIKNNRIDALEEVKCSMFNRATGFNYKETTTTVRKYHIEPAYLSILEQNGVDMSTFVVPEITEIKETVKYALPDTASAIFLLKNWGKDEGWSNDPLSLDIKKQEFELKKKQAENEDW